MKTVLLLSIVVLLLFPRNSEAYLDPGSGSYFIQVVFGLLFGAFFVFKGYLARIWKFFSGKASRRQSGNNERD